MSLIGMAVYSTEENRKDECLEKTLMSLKDTVDFSKHRLLLSINGSTDTTISILHDFYEFISGIFWNEGNIGTAKALNKVIRERKEGEHFVKIDDDIVIKQSGWLDDLEEVVRRNPKIGQAGLKRKDLIESPDRDDFYKSQLIALPHNSGERWLVVEKCHHIMGSCVLHNSLLLDKVGGLYQMEGNQYGFDDALMSLRSELSGFINVFLPHIEIEHVDSGQTNFQKWKETNASSFFKKYDETVRDYKSGKLSLYYNNC